MALDTTIGGASADSYVTLAEYEAYVAAMGLTPLSGNDTQHEAELRRAAVAMDASYQFRGTKHTVAQAREWPRSEALRNLTGMAFDPYPIRPDEIPQRVKNAQMEMAWIIHQGQNPLATYEGGVRREKIDVIEVEYAGGRGRPRFDAVDRILAPYVVSGPGQSRMVRA